MPDDVPEALGGTAVPGVTLTAVAGPVVPAPSALVTIPRKEVGTDMTAVVDLVVTAGKVLVVTQLELAAEGHTSARTSCLSQGPVGPVTHS